MKFNTPQINLGGSGANDGLEPAAEPAAAKPRKGSPKGAMRKKDRFVLFLGDDGAILVFIQRGKVVRRLFAPSPEEQHVKTFVELMQANPKAPIYMLVDMIDQSYVRHTLPPVSPLSVKKLVQRRLDRDFAPEDITGSLPLGREKTGRKEWNFLLISLASSGLFQQWMDVLLAQENRFMGTYLVPVEAQDYIERLGKATLSASQQEAAWQILVSHDKVGGFRQVVLKEGKLIFTRLTQAIADTSPEVIAGSVEQEVLNTIEYLKRLSFNEASGLNIFIVSAQEINDAVDQTKFNANAVVKLTPVDVAEALGLEQAALSADRFGDVVMAASFGGLAKPKLKMLSAYARKLDTLYNARLGVKAVAAALVVAVIGMTAMSFMGMLSNQSDEAQAQKDKRRVAQDLATIQRDLGDLGDDTNKLLSIAALYDAAKPNTLDPLVFTKEFVMLMDRTALVKQFDWQRGGSNDSGANRGRAEQAESTDTFKADIEMEFTQHGGSRQKLVKDANAFIEKLNVAFSGFDIMNEKLPGTISQDEELELNFDDPSSSSESLGVGEEIVKFTIEGPVPDKKR